MQGPLRLGMQRFVSGVPQPITLCNLHKGLRLVPDVRPSKDEQNSPILDKKGKAVMDYALKFTGVHGAWTPPDATHSHTEFKLHVSAIQNTLSRNARLQPTLAQTRTHMTTHACPEAVSTRRGGGYSRWSALCRVMALLMLC